MRHGVTPGLMQKDEMNSHGSHWFEQMAKHMGSAYLRYSFTKGTSQEVAFIINRLGLTPGMRILDVGCGPGRHAYELARLGFSVHGIDISEAFIDIANKDAPLGATFERMDARELSFSSEFDAVICLCQGAFGLMTASGEDSEVLRGIRNALRPDGKLALSAFNAYFSVKYHEDADFDADTGVSHEKTEVRNTAGEPLAVDLWTGCYTPRELRLMMEKAGLEVESILSVDPGNYQDAVPSLESSEFLVIAFASPLRREGGR